MLAAINDEVVETSSHGMFVTMIAGLYDPESQDIVFANAGHLPPLLRKPDGEFQRFEAEAPPLGVLAGVEFVDEGICLQGGSLYLYSDGVTEAGAEHELGEEGLKQMLNSFAKFPLSQRLRKMVDRLSSDGQPLHDDITLLAIESVESSPVGVLRFPADPAKLKEMRERVRELVASVGARADLNDAIVVAINEACMNVIQHGYQGKAGGEYELRIGHQQNRHALVFELLDHAPPVDRTTIVSRSLDDIRPGGLGVHFIQQLMDEMEFCRPPVGYGNLLYMSIRMDKQDLLEIS